MKNFKSILVSLVFSFFLASVLSTCTYDEHNYYPGETRLGSSGDPDSAKGRGEEGQPGESETVNGGCPKDCTSEACLTKKEDPNSTECLAENQVVYVNARDENCMTGNGSKTSPFCEVQKGIDTALDQKKPYVFVKPSYRDQARDRDAPDYLSLKIDHGKLTVVGPWANRSLKEKEDPMNRDDFISTKNIAVVGYEKKDEVTSLEVSGDADVTFDGFHFTGSVVCKSPNAILEIRHSLLESKDLSALEGDMGGKIIPKDRLLASSCKEVTIENSDIREAGKGMASVHIGDMVSYRIVNSILARSSFGVILEKDSSGVFEFNTVVANDQKGIDCDTMGKAKIIKNSIVVKNNRGDDQFTPLCQLDTVVIGPKEMKVTDPNVIRLNPDFESEFAANYRLEMGSIYPDSIKNNRACCINKAVANPQITIDYFGNPRPKGNKPDIGFQEVE